MKNSKKSLTLTIIFVLFLLVFASCNIAGNGGETFTIGLNLNGGEGIDAKDFISGNKLIEPSKVPIKKGCEFLGWYYDSDFKTEITFDAQITKNIIIFAKWSDVKWAVTFVYGGAIDSETYFVEDKGKATQPTKLPSVHGYSISGWYKNSNFSTPFSFAEAIQDDINIYAKWDIASYQINYNFDNGSPHINTIYSYTIDTSVTLSPPSRDGYDFLGWYDNADFEGEPITNITKGSYGDKDLFARYLCYKNDIERTMLGAKITQDTIAVSVNYAQETLALDSNNITVSDRATFVLYDALDQICLYNTIALPDAPSENYVETTGKIIVTSEKGTTKEYNLTIKKYATGASVTVVFDTDKAPPIGQVVIPISTQIEAPTLSAVEGYSFDGWCEDQECTILFDFDSTIGSDITLYAKFTPIAYNINYYLGVGSNVSGNVGTYTIEDTIVFADAQGTDLYDFFGWYIDKNFVQAITRIENKIGDVSVFAKYALKVDQSAMTLKYTGDQTFNNAQSSQLTKYLEYVVYNKSSTASFNLNIDIEESGYDTFIQNAWRNMEISKSTLSWTASRSGGQVTMTFTYNDYPSFKSSETDKYTQLDYFVHEDYTAVRGLTYDDFKINSVGEKVEVSSSDMLFYVLSMGYQPLPKAGSDAERMYNKAKVVLRNIIDESMTDTEKLHSIYDYLIMNVVYDKDLLTYTQGASPENIHSYNGFYLEGVFDDYRAVCDGISKAFVVLARMEGIECYQVIYSPAEGVGHAWNKVKIDGEFYIIDATSGGTIIDNSEALTHKYFMISEDKYKNLTAHDEFAGYIGTTHTDKVAESDDYNVYESITVMYGATVFDMVITTQDELNALVVIAKEYSENPEYEGRNFTLDALVTFDYGEDLADEWQTAANLNTTFRYAFDKGYIIIIVMNEE